VHLGGLATHPAITGKSLTVTILAYAGADSKTPGKVGRKSKRESMVRAGGLTWATVC
jgi:hypothetical protein